MRIILFCLLSSIIVGGCYPVESSRNVSTSQQNSVNLRSDIESNTSVSQQDKNINSSSSIVKNLSNSQPESNSSQINDNSEKLSTANYFDVTKYNGKWISSNYQIVQMDGYVTRFGSELYLKYKNGGITELNMYDISAPPANRIASIETEVKISHEGIGRFTFDNDGWGSYGSGTIELHDNQVIIIVDSQIEQANYPDWRIYSGKRVFIRENILSDGA